MTLSFCPRASGCSKVLRGPARCDELLRAAATRAEPVDEMTCYPSAVPGFVHMTCERRQGILRVGAVRSESSLRLLQAA